MKEKNRASSSVFLLVFTLLLFGSSVYLSLGEVGMQILGVQPIPLSVEQSPTKVIDVEITTTAIYSYQTMQDENE